VKKNNSDFYWLRLTIKLLFSLENLRPMQPFDNYAMNTSLARELQRKEICSPATVA
jgi:hypothetical protein